MIKLELSNQNILVTGASDGIGKEIALFLMKNGARVAVHFNNNDTSAKNIIKQYPESGSKVFKADFSMISDVEALWHDVLKEFGQMMSRPEVISVNSVLKML